MTALTGQLLVCGEHPSTLAEPKNSLETSPASLATVAWPARRGATDVVVATVVSSRVDATVMRASSLSTVRLGSPSPSRALPPRARFRFTFDYRARRERRRVSVERGATTLSRLHGARESASTRTTNHRGGDRITSTNRSRVLRELRGVEAARLLSACERAAVDLRERRGTSRGAFVGGSKLHRHNRSSAHPRRTEVSS